MKKQVQNESDIMGLITKVQEQLTLLGNKVDILLTRSLPRPAEVKPPPQTFQPPTNTHAQNKGRQENRFQNQSGGGGRQDDRHRERVMYKAICADCKKECEVPFRPSEDRPVYCRECFSRRKAGGSFKANIDTKPKETAPAQTISIDNPPVSAKKKPVTKKKPVGKKKPASGKRKKGK